MTAFLSVFITIFIAELGDKTQIAAALFAAEGDRPAWLVFLATSAALVASAGAAVLLGGAAGRFVQGPTLKIIAGVAFIVIGALMIRGALKGAGAA
ncbi:MAG: TMEM165/GDT1 family protein [Hydrogenophilaceae bacterium]|jgi:putative Ca2+/H+ antiporter (TMEM165/GDT1 family)|nr:TMEM165/GDT1 family protein [Hydrogenophilaceae bacterium]